MRSDATRKGADCTGKTRGGELAGAADAELELDLLEHRPDLLHGLTDLRRISLERTCPEVERLGLEFDSGGIGRGVARPGLCHALQTRLARRGSTARGSRGRRRRRRESRSFG